MERFISFFGLLLMLFAAYLLSTNKKKVCWRTVASGIGLQIFLGLIILKTSFGKGFFEYARTFFTGILAYTNEGSKFIFGSLTGVEKFGFIFFVQVLPTILFMSALMSILYHLGVMQVVIRFMAKIMVKVMGTSGGESLAAAANVFAGQTEAPLVIRPFISKMTKSELMALMTGGMATVAGGVLAAYVGFGVDAAHLLAASVMSAPAALVCAKLLVPETESSQTHGDLKLEIEKETTNLVDAAAHGASEGLKLALNVGAMLLAFIALIAMFNGILSFVGGWFNYPELSMELISGYLFAPVAWLLGVPWADCQIVGSLLGKKMILNEFVAYLDLTKAMSEGALSERAIIISTYALCGFANFSSIAIQVGGIGVLAPDRRKDLAELGVKSMIGGTLACLMTAAVAGMFL
ncbi:probable Na+ dependent nucleoside transporter [Halobacteriovorax marinus SJ]|uniref:Nucleoside permease n=1 Tax=Halobacteriovorax marinus (strain ATCC BAA-682 / DSM 15412 / SJ) TaxID=862908 RepID=E1WXH7_HALMS|nr:NupC/NupG family nucleoside CNT transporter [Halobacteriovorax marinus]CBW27494.1 probable Na+ dependent nucleoside transporter [Halobacteriovorax marinus SJ]